MRRIQFTVDGGIIEILGRVREEYDAIHAPSQSEGVRGAGEQGHSPPESEKPQIGDLQQEHCFRTVGFGSSLTRPILLESRSHSNQALVQWVKCRPINVMRPITSLGCRREGTSLFVFCDTIRITSSSRCCTYLVLGRRVAFALHGSRDTMMC